MRYALVDGEKVEAQTKAKGICLRSGTYQELGNRRGISTPMQMKNGRLGIAQVNLWDVMWKTFDGLTHKVRSWLRTI